MVKKKTWNELNENLKLANWMRKDREDIRRGKYKKGLNNKILLKERDILEQ